MIEIIRAGLTALFLLMSAAVFFTEMVGVTKFKYVLNRMHASASGDTLGLLLAVVGGIMEQIEQAGVSIRQLADEIRENPSLLLRSRDPEPLPETR